MLKFSRKTPISTGSIKKNRKIKKSSTNTKISIEIDGKLVKKLIKAKNPGYSQARILNFPICTNIQFRIPIIIMIFIRQKKGIEKTFFLHFKKNSKIFK